MNQKYEKEPKVSKRNQKYPKGNKGTKRKQRYKKEPKDPTATKNI